jgi:iron complex transport system permease protein
VSAGVEVATGVRDAPSRTPVSHDRAVRAVGIALLLLLTLAVITVVSLMLGAPRLSASEAMRAVIDGDASDSARLVVTRIRAPRLLLAVGAGAALGVAGALLQTALRNPLAGPELLGVGASAAVGVAVVTVFATGVSFATRPFVAAATGAVGGAVVLLLARTRRDPVRVVLLGACVAALANALVIVILALGTANDIGLFQRFVLGSLTNRTWEHLGVVVPWIVGGLLVAFLLGRPLTMLRLGDDVAASVGVPVAGVRWSALVTATVLTAAVVTACGQIGFVALLAPHLVRTASRIHDDRIVLPLSALTGATLLAAADLGAREVLAPRELPVGAVTAAIGGAALLVLLPRLRRAAW